MGYDLYILELRSGIAQSCIAAWHYAWIKGSIAYDCLLKNLRRKRGNEANAPAPSQEKPACRPMQKGCDSGRLLAYSKRMQKA